MVEEYCLWLGQEGASSEACTLYDDISSIYLDLDLSVVDSSVKEYQPEIYCAPL